MQPLASIMVFSSALPSDATAYGQATASNNSESDFHSLNCPGADLERFLLKNKKPLSKSWLPCQQSLQRQDRGDLPGD